MLTDPADPDVAQSKLHTRSGEDLQEYSLYENLVRATDGFVTEQFDKAYLSRRCLATLLQSRFVRHSVPAGRLNRC